jgi:hypothetical protein
MCREYALKRSTRVTTKIVYDMWTGHSIMTTP